MNRRAALQRMGILSSGMLFWSSCDFSKEEPSFFTDDEKTTLAELTNAILPLEGTPIETPDIREKFIEKVVEVCLSPEDAGLYRTGLAELGELLKGDPELVILKINPQSDAMKLCFKETRALCIEHFTSSEYFLKQEMNYQFIPEPYKACVTV